VIVMGGWAGILIITCLEVEFIIYTIRGQKKRKKNSYCKDCGVSLDISDKI
jgi:hypothetical protein